jgi:DNA end-binding protein Ku
VKKLVEAKRKGKPLPVEEPAPKQANVVNIMDTLRQSLGKGKSTKAGRAEKAPRSSAKKTATRKKKAA